MKRDSNIQAFDSERPMLEAFITKLHKIDPDLLIAHNLCAGMIEVLLSRIQYLKVPHWSRIGRFKRTTIPNRKTDSTGVSFGGSFWIPRLVSCGRLLVDTFLTSKELIRETNYDLSHLAKVQLKKDRSDCDEEQVPRFYDSTSHLL